MKRLFNKLSGREQGLLLLLIWSGLLYWGGSALRAGIAGYQAYDLHADAINGHNQTLAQRSSIEGKIRERLKSHDNSFSRGKLENIAEKVAKAIDPGARYAGIKPQDMGELFSQHTVGITFKNVQWENLKDYVKRIKDFSPGMFLSEVEISPRYRSRSDGIELENYGAVFKVSSLELKKKRF